MTTREHPAVFTVEQSRALRGNLSGAHCKNLFLKDKKGQLWLIVSLEDACVDLKLLRRTIGSAHLSFGSADLLAEVLGVDAGAVTPFAVMNDTERCVKVVLHRAMMKNALLNYHPLVNTATTTIRSQDLLKFIHACGNTVQIVSLDTE